MTFLIQAVNVVSAEGLKDVLVLDNLFILQIYLYHAAAVLYAVMGRQRVGQD